MKFYNPFKAHVVRGYEGTYYIRKWSLGWLFLDDDGLHWWKSGYRRLSKRCGSEELARQFLKWYKNKDKVEVV